MNIAHQSPLLQHAASHEVEVIDLRRYYRAFLRFRNGIFGLGLLSAIVAGLLSLRADDIYQSSATLQIESMRPNITSIEDIYGLNAQNREYFSTQFELLKGRKLAERVINEMNLLEQPEFMPPQTPVFDWRRYLDFLPAILTANPSAEVTPELQEQIRMTWALDEFQQRLGIAPIRNTDLVKIHFESTDPQLAAAVANQLALAFTENYLEQRMLSTQQASDWMTERLAMLKTTLETSEARLQSFLEAERLVDIEGVAALNIQELDELTTQNNEARRVRAEAETAYRQTQQLADTNSGALLKIPAILNHPVISRVSDTIDALEQQLAELSRRYGRNHPRMIALASQMQEAESNLQTQVQQVLATIETDYIAALDNERVTLARLDAAKLDYQGVNRKSYALRELEREVETNRELYDLFFTRIRETNETDSFQASNALVVDPAVAALEPAKPRRGLIVLLALLCGIVAGTLLAFLRDMLDNTVHTPADIENNIHSTTLGLVPLVRNNRQGDKDSKLAYAGFLEDSHSGFSEAFRTIRTSLMLLSIDKPRKFIAVTSSIPNEGKTTVSFNMAMVLGQMKRTLLIDADMRRPTLAKSLDLPLGAPGLADYIAGTAELSDCIYAFPQGSISIMPSGHTVPNPLELLASPKFRELLELLGQSWDQIILDTPPTQAVSDALVIGNLVDEVVYVVKAGSTPITIIKHGLARLRQSGCEVLGITLNQVDTGKQSDYYGYGGVYDSYGYSSKPDEPFQAAPPSTVPFLMKKRRAS